MEDDPRSWVNARDGVPEANFLHTSSLHSCYAERKVEARRGLEVLAQEVKHFHCFRTPVKDWGGALFESLSTALCHVVSAYNLLCH